MILYLLLASRLFAADVITPRFQGSAGGGVQSGGAHQVVASASQAAASVLLGGVHAIQAGFWSFLGGDVVSGSASGETLVQTLSPSAGPVTVTIPAGALPAGTAVTVQIPAASAVPAALASERLLQLANTAIEIISAEQPRSAVTIVFSYLNADLTGFRPERFMIARYDDTARKWIPLISSVDDVNKTVTAGVKHFSIFQIMQSNPSDTVETVRVVPNPFRPAQGHTAMGFFNLPANARVRIYTFTGERVRNLTANAAGLAVWDGKNDDGTKAASGVYFAYAEGAGQSKTFKVAIQR